VCLAAATYVWVVGAAPLTPLFVGAQPAPDGQLPTPPDSPRPSKAVLPAAPEPIAQLIAAGKVEFDFYDESRQQYDFAGETTFNFRYHYRCRTKYRIIESPPGDAAAAKTSEAELNALPRSIEVSVEYVELALEHSHRMRLPSRLIGNDFFQTPLVVHEFDHVAISSDRRLQSRLAAMLQERNRVILAPLATAASTHEEYSELARQVARQRTQRVFDDFVALTKIRYQELDRLTAHGLEPLLPADRTRLLTP